MKKFLVLLVILFLSDTISDPKTGNPNDYPNGFGPQGDAIRIYNYVRLVRNAGTDK